MSQFLEKDFNASQYNKFRPHYPAKIFDTVLSYHSKANGSNPIELLIDLGCGPGEATYPLANYDQIKKVIGTDISQVMVSQASELNDNEKITFKVASGEDLGSIGIGEGEVDLVTAAECSHWFNHALWFKEMARVLKDNGTIAYWSYVDVVFIDEPIANEINDQFTYLDPRYCGPLWQQPGKEHLRIGMIGVDQYLAENGDFTDITTVRYDPRVDKEQTALYISKEMTMGDFVDFLDTWSAVHSWWKINKDLPVDIVDLWFQEFEKRLGWNLTTKINAIWKTHYTFARRVVRA